MRLFLLFSTVFIPAFCSDLKEALTEKEFTQVVSLIEKQPNLKSSVLDTLVDLQNKELANKIYNDFVEYLCTRIKANKDNDIYPLYIYFYYRQTLLEKMLESKQSGIQYFSGSEYSRAYINKLDAVPKKRILITDAEYPEVHDDSDYSDTDYDIFEIESLCEDLRQNVKTLCSRLFNCAKKHND